MNYAYARVSTDKQDHERQKAILMDYPIDETFFEIISGGKESRKRPVFKQMYEKLQPNDTVYFTEVTRMSRSNIDLVNTVKDLTENKKVKLVFIVDNIVATEDFKNQMDSKFNFGLKAILAEREKDLISMRVKQGLKAARLEGRVGGRPRNEELRDKVLDLLRQGEKQKTIAQELGITQSYVSHIKCEWKKKQIEERKSVDIYEI